MFKSRSTILFTSDSRCH